MAVICAWQKSPTAGIATSHARIAPRDILLMSAKAIRGVLIFMLMILTRQESLGLPIARRRSQTVKSLAKIVLRLICNLARHRTFVVPIKLARRRQTLL